MRILVTGGAGFIGSHLVDAFLADGRAVAVVDDLSTGKRENLNPLAGFHRVDIRDPEALAWVFTRERPETVCHYAAQTDVRRSMADPVADAQTNIVGSLNVLECCRRGGVRRVLFASTCAVYGPAALPPVGEGAQVRPESAYGVGKAAVELYLALYAQAYGLVHTVFRLGNIYGPRQDPKGEAGVVAIFSGQLLAGETPTIFGDGSKTRDYVYVEDVVRANRLALDGRGDGGIFNLGWGREVTDFELFDAVRRAVGVAATPRYAPKRPGEAERIALEASKARSELGWTPQVSLADGVERSVAYYRERGLHQSQ